MGHIKEPDGIDFVVDSKPLSDTERKQISEIIEHYKATGRKMKLQSPLAEEKSTNAQQAAWQKQGGRL